MVWEADSVTGDLNNFLNHFGNTNEKIKQIYKTYVPDSELGAVTNE